VGILGEVHKALSFWLNRQGIAGFARKLPAIRFLTLTANDRRLALNCQESQRPESFQAGPEYIENVNLVLQHCLRPNQPTSAWNRAGRTVATLMAIACITGAANAQTAPPRQIPSILQRPAPIPFAQWREVDQSDSGTEYVVEFPSPLPGPYPANNVVPLRVFMPVNPSGRIPVVLVLHYWGATDLRNERALAQELNRGNVAAAVMTLPYHLSRTPPGRHSGEMAIQPDPEEMVLTMTQAVLDVRRSIDFLWERPEFDHSKLGLAGTSLGALVAELAYGADERITDVAFVLGGVDLAHIVWSSSLLVRQRDVLIHRGFTETSLREAIRAIEPLTYLARRKTAPALVIGGQYDTVIKQQSTQELIASLTDPKVLWLDTGHYGGIFVQRRLMREMARFFKQEFAGTAFIPPAKLYAPTIRLGLKVDTGNGFDIGAGLDLLKFDKKGDSFMTLFVTPRGPELFLGRDVSQGFSVGVVGSTHKSGVALLWSAVL
jgi:dienelactone hydrolase